MHTTRAGFPAIPKKVRPLIKSQSFPLSYEAIFAIKTFKYTLASATLQPNDFSQPLTKETDASEFAIASTLNQDGRAVAFHSRTLSLNEQRHSAIEKEAYAIVEALRKWRHLLIGRHFTIVTDPKSVSFIFDAKHSSKIKNEKIFRWRLELSSFSYTVLHRPGKQNTGPDTLSRGFCGNIGADHLRNLHNALCHPGVTRINHFVRSKNLPYSISEIRQMTSNCEICLELKPNFAQLETRQLIKATQVFERLNLDFKGPLPSNSRNRYFLTVIDEYSRFPFAFPCADLTPTSVIKCLQQLFSVFGMSAYIYSDRWSSFQSNELKAWLQSHGVAISRTTSYYPQGNGQCEKYNGTIWKAVQAALKSRNLPLTHWKVVLQNTLHSIRSLLCTSINSS